MKEKICGICLTFLYIQTCSASQSLGNVLAEVGKTVALPCNKQTNGEIEWYQNQKLLIRCTTKMTLFGSAVKDRNRYKVHSHATNDLTVTSVELSDSGTYTCQHKEVSGTVQLFVFQVSALPSLSLLQSEDLVLELKSSPSTIPGFKVSWEKDGNVQSEDPRLEENNMQRPGRYVCRINKAGGNELTITRDVNVFGFEDIPPIVYTSGTRPVTIPWTFNFNIRDKHSNVQVEEGSIRFASHILNQLSVTEGVVGWPETSDSKDVSEKSTDLSIQLLNPKSGRYQMEILLKMGGRRRNLTRETCVSSLTVSDSKSDLSAESRVPLECRVTCLDIKHKLCWQQLKTNLEMCGQPGQTFLKIEVTSGNVTEAIWTCGITSGKERLLSANVTLAVKSDFVDLSNSLFWVTIGVGILLIVLIVVTIVLVVARNRRVKRAQHRAWLLENLHQQRRCECKGFAPQRLRENI